MAARGTEAKKEVVNKILSTFEGAFLWNDNKEIRIPVHEGGEIIQIKVTLTAAKENVSAGDVNGNIELGVSSSPNSVFDTKLTPEEEKNVADFFNKLMGKK